MEDDGWPAVTEFDDYVRARYGELRRLAFLLIGDWATADDAVQTALIRCERRWEIIQDPQRHAYVRQALVNTASTWRVRRKMHRPLSELESVAARDQDVDQRLAMMDVLRRLPLGQRQVVVLRYYEGLSESEIARTLGLSAGTVKSRASRALATLRASELRGLVAEQQT